MTALKVLELCRALLPHSIRRRSRELIEELYIWIPRSLVWLLRVLAVKLGAGRRGTVSEFYAAGELPIFFINLASRSDRRQSIQRELRELGQHKVHRILATPDENGALGCARSHLRIAERMAAAPTIAIVLEDDVTFVAEPGQIFEVVAEFLQDRSLDVLCLAHRSKRTLAWNSSLLVSNDIQTTAAYLVKARAWEALERSFRKSVEELSIGMPVWESAIDIKWKKAQTFDLLFAVPRQQLAVQRYGWSDISRSFVGPSA